MLRFAHQSSSERDWRRDGTTLVHNEDGVQQLVLTSGDLHGISSNLKSIETTCERTEQMRSKSAVGMRKLYTR